MKKNVTIQDVATVAKVSKTTVSRYINGNYGKMSLQTKRKIQTVIDELNYRPSKQAQGLKNNKSGLIGLLIADIENLFSAYLIKAAQEALIETNYQLIIMNTNNDPLEERKAIQKLLDQNVEGILLQATAPRLRDYQNIIDAQIPTVLIDRVLDQNYWTTVQTDNLSVTKRMAQEILKRDYQKIVVVTEALNNISTRIERLEGIKLGVMGSGKPITVDVIELTGRSSGEVVAAYLRSMDDQKTAFFASNGNALYEVVAASMLCDLVFPEDIGICGFDDWFWPDLIKPGITTIHQDPYQIGIKGAELLLAEIQQAQVRQKIEIPAEIVVRKSL